MHIVTCLKAIWRTDTALRLQNGDHALNPDGRHPVLNPADRAALGVALRLQASIPEAGIHAITVGPPTWEGILRDALAVGAAEATRVWQPDRTESETLAVDGSADTTLINARAVAGVLRTLQPVLVLAGAASGDAGHGCFGAYLAEALGMAYAHAVTEVEAIPGGWRVVVELERGYTQRMDLPAPAVVTVPPHIAGPTEASLPALLRSRSASIRNVTVALPAPGHTTTTVRAPVPRVKRYTVPPATLNAEQRIQAMVTLPTGSGGVVVGAEQSPEQQAEAILGLLKSKGYLPG
ncbi:MAG TPA: hypothetical protein VF678_15440 [bacterium]